MITFLYIMAIVYCVFSIIYYFRSKTEERIMAWIMLMTGILLLVICYFGEKLLQR